MPQEKTAALASAAGVTLSPSEFLTTLKRRRRLPDLVRQALAEKLIIESARAAGLVVAAQELQQAANRFRRQAGLSKSESTERWLHSHGLSAAEFGAALEDELLIEKFRQHLVDTCRAAHFEFNRDVYARARLHHLVVASEAEARELLCQIQEGAEFADLARRHSLDAASCAAGGALGIVLRCQLPVAVGDSVFSARAGDVVGPLATNSGFALFQVQMTLPPEMDERTVAWLREEVFTHWLTEKMRDVSIDLAMLEWHA